MNSKKQGNTEIVIRDFNEEELSLKASEEINSKNLETYQDGHVGFFSRSDACGAIGGGMGIFFWFKNYNELYQFLADYFVVLAPGPADQDHKKVFNDVAGIIKDLAAQKIQKEDAIAKINKTARNFSQLEWIGFLEDLETGNSPFAVALRKSFIEDRKDEKDSEKRVILRSDRDEFIEYLGTFGI